MASKTVRIEIGVWFNESTGNIHLSARGVPSFKVTTVRRDPASKRGHPHLYEKLAQCLRDHGVPAPAEAMSDA
jgi:hypothetical protein